MTTQNILELARTAAGRYDMDVQAAEDAMRIYISQIEKLEGRELDEDAIADDDAEFLLGCLEAVQDTPQGDQRLNDVIDAAQALADHDQQREHLISTRDIAVCKAADAGVPRQAIADAAGLKRARIQQIIRERKQK